MSSAQLMVDVINSNDNEPIFTQLEYRMKVLENSPKGTVVGKVEAKDNDDGTYNIASVYNCINIHIYCWVLQCARA